MCNNQRHTYEEVVIERLSRERHLGSSKIGNKFIIHKVSICAMGAVL